MFYSDLEGNQIVAIEDGAFPSNIGQMWVIQISNYSCNEPIKIAY